VEVGQDRTKSSGYSRICDEGGHAHELLHETEYGPEGEGGSRGGHGPGHVEESERDANAHRHGHGHGHTHSHFDTAVGEEDDPLKGLLPAMLGIVGIIAGFIIKHLGYSAYWMPFFAASILAGYPVAKAGIAGFLAGEGANIDLLTSVAGIGAMFVGEWAEGALVLTLFSLGEYLEERAGEKTRRSIREAMDLAPRKARVKRGNEIREVLVQEIVPGDTVLIFPGERISADGKVTSGESSVDESHITGEAIPVDKVPGDNVYAGSLNGEGALEVLATKKAHDTTLARIMSMVEAAHSRRAKSQRLVDEFARYWTPLMMVLATIVSVGVPIALRQPFRLWVYRGLTLLIVACPCSLVISTPVTVVAAIARAARNGVLIKGGIHLEDLGRLRAVAFDKTGTITTGKVIVEDVLASQGTGVNGAGKPSESEEAVWADSLKDGTGLGSNGDDPEKATNQVLALAAAVESRSEHPLAKAIVEAALGRGLRVHSAEGFMALRGKGARAVVCGQETLVGNQELLEESGTGIPQDLKTIASSLMGQGKTVVFVGLGGSSLGLIGLTDAVRSEAKIAVERLKRDGLHVVMLTGDSRQTAAYVGEKVGITEFKAGLLPQDKLDEIQNMKARFGYVGMVGDGVNDAPSLAEATVGIGMARGADVALETSDVALIAPDLEKIPWVIGLARRSRTLIVENVGFSIGLKVLALVLVFGGILPLWAAVLADSGASILVTLNGLRILRHR